MPLARPISTTYKSVNFNAALQVLYLGLVFILRFSLDQNIVDVEDIPSQLVAVEACSKVGFQRCPHLVAHTFRFLVFRLSAITFTIVF